MAEPARALADIGEVVTEALPTVDLTPRLGEAPKALARRMVADERQRSEARQRKLREAIQGIATWEHPSEGFRRIQESARALLSARISAVEARLESDRAVWADIYGRIPLPSPLGALREIERGFKAVLEREHDALVDAYYTLLAVLAEADPTTKIASDTLTSADDIDAYFDRVLGT